MARSASTRGIIRAERNWILLPKRFGQGTLREAAAWDTGDDKLVPPREIRSTNGALMIPRMAGGVDRLYSRFACVAAGRSGPWEWVTDVQPDEPVRHEIPIPRSIKGITCPVDLDDVIALGTRWVNTNVNLRDVLDLGNPSPAAWHVVDGERFPIRTAYLEQLDRTIRRLTDAGIHVVVVLNNPLPRNPPPDDPFVHPGTDVAAAPNRLGAFALHNQRSFRAYRAVIETFAARYSRPDRRHGWIGGYIVGNEIQQHWEWYNRGRVDADTFLMEYMTALRTTWLALRRCHPDLRAYVSMDHHWTGTMKGDPTREIPGRTVLETLDRLSKREGDFDWHVAFHPYPENLFEPRFWQDKHAPVAFDAPKITFRNLEVLPSWLDKPAHRVNGVARRVILSEQGFHAADSEQGEILQAAALAAATARVERIPGIDAFMLHRHVSHRNEGGLRLGLWSWDPDSPDPSAPGRKFRAWEVFKAIDTPDWKARSAFALEQVGIRDWNALRPVKRIPETTPRPKPAPGVVLDLVQAHGDAVRTDCADWRIVDATVAGRTVEGIFHHPLPQGVAIGTFRLSIPGNGDCEVRFHTGFAAATRNGARFSVRIDGKEVWNRVQTTIAFQEGRVSLAPWRGKSIALSLCVDGMGDITHDWCVWAAPTIRRQAP